LAPHLWWLVDADFPPFRYVDARAATATHWYQYVTFPLQWTVGQAWFLAPALALLALAAWPDGSAAPAESGDPRFARRLIAVLALGPFIITPVAALVLGRLPIAMWGFPLWSFAPLAILMWFPPQPRRFAAFARAFLVVLLAMPLAYAGAE